MSLRGVGPFSRVGQLSLREQQPSPQLGASLWRVKGTVLPRGCLPALWACSSARQEAAGAAMQQHCDSPRAAVEPASLAQNRHVSAELHGSGRTGHQDMGWEERGMGKKGISAAPCPAPKAREREQEERVQEGPTLREQRILLQQARPGESPRKALGRPLGPQFWVSPELI